MIGDEDVAGLVTALPGSVLLLGVVGSTAYGLQTPGSDVDRLGVYAASPLELTALDDAPAESVVWKDPDPDITVHEARKAALLLLNGNPAVMELLWLDQYETLHPLGQELVGIRSSFLASHRVRQAYLGYVNQQMAKVYALPAGEDAGWRRRREAKHARHLMRLCQQGLHLYRTGELRVRVDNPAAVHTFGERVADGERDILEDLAADTVARFHAASSPLPSEPDLAPVRAWLNLVRRESLPDAGLRRRVADLADGWRLRPDLAVCAAELNDLLTEEIR